MERFSKENGQGLAEYGLVIALVSIATAASLLTLGSGVLSMYLSNLATLLGAL